MATDGKIGTSHLARKAIFRRGVQEGRLTVEEIEAALPPEALMPAERWLLYYSLRAAGVEIVGDTGSSREERREDRQGPEAGEPEPAPI
jgi:hypothetical protein